MDSVTTRTSSAATKRRIDSIEPRQKAMSPIPPFLKRRGVLLLSAMLAAATVVGGVATHRWWAPRAGRFLSSVGGALQGDSAPTHEQLAEVDPHAGHDDSAVDTDSLELSLQAQKNIGLRVATVAVRDFDRTINVPAIVKERQGQTQLKVSAPMTGIVARIYPIRGEAIAPQQPLFDIRLTHEDLVDTQSTFLQTVEQLDVIKREVVRLEEVTASGAIAGKRLLERQYELQQTEARLRAQRQALVLHGLTQVQIEGIETTRTLLQQVTFFAPPRVATPQAHGDEIDLLQVSQIEVSRGEYVNAGQLLCILSNHAVLYIEGNGFEEDSRELDDAANRGSPITAVIEANGGGPDVVSDLTILYVENQIDLDSRALRFYVRLPNKLVRNEQTEDGHRFIGWRFKPGQRVELLVPVERWADRIVLPVDAVVNEGADWFVFQQNGNRFERKPVYVEYRDQRWAVLSNDGSVFPDDAIVVAGAYQMHLALKNKSGGGVDPHAGHGH
jgi:cobalt-zinc-cadmium efflux system membrane fusion protein